ncbi:hypothetical protein MRB53_024768 [Persea americana]|uniref:Uncharacterized protein n=1 Tax=Persea americana TaxID=3435 RepID=A0ACC2LDW2_PERAE|nr:hypothetical protein MRB53_024768 [Persea americana]
MALPICYSSSLSIISSSSSSSSSTKNMEKEKAGGDTTSNRKKVVVCGGGVIGVCTAYFLSKKGALVTLLEKSSVACAASGKAGGFLALDWCDGSPVSALARSSFNLHRSLALELDGPTSYGYRPLNTLSLSIDPTTAPTSSSIPNWIDGPVRNPRTIGTVENTAQVHPQLFTRTLLSTAVEKYGVEVVIGKAEGVEVDDTGRATGVSATLRGGDGGSVIIPADAVVFALGPWSGRFSLLTSLFRVSGLKAHSIVLRPREPEAITPDALFLHYNPGRGAKPLDPEVYPRPTGEVYICGMSEDAEVPDDPEEIVGRKESIRMLHKVAEMVSSRLGEGEGVEVEAEQACFLPCTEDGLPVIGEMPGVKGCYVATGHSCWGILNGPATGATLAQLVLDGRTAVVDLTPFSPARFLSSSRRPR